MTVKDMQYRFGIKINQLDSALEMTTDDIEYWLNRAQLAIVKDAYESFTKDKRIYEQNPERVDDFRVLIKRDLDLDTTHDPNERVPSGYYADVATLPADYMFLLANKSLIFYNYPSIDVTITANKRTATEYGERISVNEVVQPDDIYDLLSDPFNTTRIKRPICTINDDTIRVFTDDKFIVDKVVVDYLKTPVPMNIENATDSELPEHLHDEILDLAVNLFVRSASVSGNRQQEQEVE